MLKTFKTKANANKYQLTLVGTARWPLTIALYTQLDAQCDQQSAIGSRLDG